MTMLRPAAVAGMFYPADAAELSRQIDDFLAQAPKPAPGAPVPKALIAPHAGYVYSGPVAAHAYALVAPARGRISRVVLMGPSHRVAFRGIATCGADAWATPLGTVAIDRAAVDRLAALPMVGTLDKAHAAEHSLEVHLPFLQATLGEFQLVPLVAGETPREVVAAVLEEAWGGPETLVVVSTDLSHYLDYESCRAADHATRTAIEHLDPAAIGSAQWKDVGPRLLQLAWSSIRARLAGGTVAPPSEPAALTRPGACFVTLKRDGRLRGCIGSPQAWRPLGQDVVDNAAKAAFEDSRFAPLTAPELDGLTLSVSVLTAPVPMRFTDEADLLRQLRPGIDGLIIEDGGHRALFLPAVWEQLPDPAQFLAHLKAKAGMRVDHWSPHFKASRFHAVEAK